MGVDSYSISLIIDPVAFVDISVYMSELTLAMSSVIFPVSFVLSSICPFLLAKAVTESSLPLTFIGGLPSLESVQRSFLSRSIGIVDLLTYSLPLFSYCKV